MTPQDLELKSRCSRFLSGHTPRSVKETLAAMAAAPEAELTADFYGTGGAVPVLERQMAQLLGKEQALFFIKGMIGQGSVLQALCRARGTASVAIHPLSHMDYDEADTLNHLHGLRPIRLGRNAPFTRAALEGVREPLAAVVVELPLRRAGYLLPAWEELADISAWCRSNGVPLHFDGARLLEAAAGYGRSPAEVAALADSVYVSFYKGLGGIGGCVVAGAADFIGQLHVWKSRQAGNVFTTFPQALSALDGLRRHLPRMAAYRERARALAAAIRAEGLCIVNPQEPHVNAFQLLLPGMPGPLSARNRAFAEKHGVWLFNAFQESVLEGHSVAEIVIGDAADGWADSDACGWLKEFPAS